MTEAVSPSKVSYFFNRKEKTKNFKNIGQSVEKLQTEELNVRLKNRRNMFGLWFLVNDQRDAQFFYVRGLEL